MYTTSHQPMRAGSVRVTEGTERVSLPRQRPGRSADRRRAIAESVGVR